LHRVLATSDAFSLERGKAVACDDFRRRIIGSASASMRLCVAGRRVSDVFAAAGRQLASLASADRRFTCGFAAYRVAFASLLDHLPARAESALR
jgi:hypothetical protein